VGEARERAAALAERSQLARDLHDVVGRGAVAATTGCDDATDRGQPSAAIMCQDLASRPAWRVVVSVRSWRD
jgi:hypothetical protein